jgi:hypothetical protein
VEEIQSAMGIERSEFPELEDIDEGYQELTDEEIQAKREEKGEWRSNLNFGTNEEKSGLDKQLLKEEQEAEDDWWFN